MAHIAGYKFKPTHYEVHYLRGEFDPAMGYSANFTRNASEAHRFTSWSLAKETIDKVLDQFEPDKEYTWTPVVESDNDQVME